MKSCRSGLDYVCHLYFAADSFASFRICCCCLFRAAPATYGSSQARGWTGAVAASLHHSPSNAGSKLDLQPTPQLSWQWRILNLLSEVKDRTHILMDTSQVLNCWATMGPPASFRILFKFFLLMEIFPDQTICYWALWTHPFFLTALVLYVIIYVFIYLFNNYLHH